MSVDYFDCAVMAVEKCENEKPKDIYEDAYCESCSVLNSCCKNYDILCNKETGSRKHYKAFIINHRLIKLGKE